MIVCPNCNHSNPDGAQACEACYTSLPTTTSCPNCGAAVESDASFCGQCGSNLEPSVAAQVTQTTAPDSSSSMPKNLEYNEPLVEPNPSVSHPISPPPTPVIATVVSGTNPEPTTGGQLSTPKSQSQSSPPPVVLTSVTQLQSQQKAALLHIQTDRLIELPQNLSVIHMGKPNDRIPPDIDVSGFPNSEIVSRIHADIRVEGDACYIEDVGSSNGTYINNLPLLPGNRHRLRAGDRIALGKGDLVSFLFQLS